MLALFEIRPPLPLVPVNCEVPRPLWLRPAVKCLPPPVIAVPSQMPPTHRAVAAPVTFPLSIRRGPCEVPPMWSRPPAKCLPPPMVAASRQMPPTPAPSEKVNALSNEPPTIPGDRATQGAQNPRNNAMWSIISLTADAPPPRLLLTDYRVNFEDHCGRRQGPRRVGEVSPIA